VYHLSLRALGLDAVHCLIVKEARAASPALEMLEALH